MTTFDTIKEQMQVAGLYSPLYDLQIAEAAAAIDERKKMQQIVKREGRILMKETQKGTEPIAHPLLTLINQYHKTVLQQLASLGLNRLKVDAPANNKTTLNNFLTDIEDGTK